MRTLLKQLGYLLRVVFYVAGSQGDEYVETSPSYHVKYLVLGNQLAVPACEVVVDECAGDTRYGFLACGIDIYDGYVIQL